MRYCKIIIISLFSFVIINLLSLQITHADIKLSDEQIKTICYGNGSFIGIIQIAEKIDKSKYNTPALSKLINENPILFQIYYTNWYQKNFQSGYGAGCLLDYLEKYSIEKPQNVTNKIVTDELTKYVQQAFEQLDENEQKELLDRISSN